MIINGYRVNTTKSTRKGRREFLIELFNREFVCRSNRLEEELTRNSRYINENVDLHIFKSQLENSYRELKEENECCERERFELQEQMIDMESQLQVIRLERDQYLTSLLNTEHDLKAEAVWDERRSSETHPSSFSRFIDNDWMNNASNSNINWKKWRESWRPFMILTFSLSLSLEQPTDLLVANNDRWSEPNQSSRSLFSSLYL